MNGRAPSSSRLRPLDTDVDRGKMVVASEPTTLDLDVGLDVGLLAAGPDARLREEARKRLGIY